ncbi:MAG: ptrA 4 [Planctomycetota bacterium]|nr:ptrA 4 [Planctomycetota bacterium]
MKMMRVVYLSAVAMTLIAAPLARADSPPKKVATVEGITEYRFDNGLRLLLFPDGSSPKVTVNMTVLVGSRHEGYGESGMAHLLEHMVFKGTPKHGDIPGAMKARGATFNGSTNSDRTNYYETLPASDENLAFAINMEADRLVNSYVKAEDLRTEFSVVRNEFESGENSPQRVLNQRMMAVAYEWHNYGKSTIGNRSDIERVPIHNLQAFYRKFYQPDNVVVIVGGKFDETKALDLVAKSFGSIPRPDRKLDATYTEEPAQDGERVVTLRRVGDVPSLGVLYHVPAMAHPDFPAVQVLAGILSAEPSGRLYKALVEPKKATSARAFAQAMHDPGVMEVSAEVPKNGSLDEVRDGIYAVIDAVKAKGVTKEEVERARQQFLKARELAASDVNQIAVRLSESVAQGDWRLYFVARDRIEGVTPEQVQAVAAKYLTTSNRTLGQFLPSDTPQRTPVPATPDLADLVDDYKGRSASSAGESFDVSPLAIQKRVVLPPAIEGVKVALLPKKTRGETVNLVLTLHYGDAESLKGMNEAASMLPSLMLRGTKTLTRQQMEDELDRLRARISAGAGGGGGRRGGGGGGGGGGLGTVTFSVEAKRGTLAETLEILRKVLREPTLPASDFEVMKLGRIARLEQGRADPQALGANRLARLMSTYPEGDVRYVPTIDEDIARSKSASIDQVRQLYSKFLGAEHGELAIVGDFEPSEILPILAKTLEGWKSSKPFARIERPFQAGISAVKETILTPDKANAVFLGAMTMPIREDHPDYPALVAGNFLLGGGTLSSRIGNRLRQKEGLSYGASSSFSADSLDNNARLMITAIFNPANARKVEIGVAEELARLIRDGVEAAELNQAVAGYLQQQQVRRSSDPALAGMLARDLYLGRTLQFEADMERQIQRLTPETVSAALRKHLDPARLTTITAGDLRTDPPSGK